MYLTARSKNIKYELLGSGGELIVFVHGWGGTIKSLRALAMRASKKYTCLVFDLPGFGTSDNPDPDWGVEEYAACVREVIEHVGTYCNTSLQNTNGKQSHQVPFIHYFGHSFGGSLGIYLAAKKMVEMKQLVLCCSSYKRTQPGGKDILQYVPKTPTQHLKQRLRLLYYRVRYPQSDIWRFPHLESNFRKIVSQDLTDLVPQITVPTLIIGAEKDTATPPELAKELHEKIPESKLVIIPNATHGLPKKEPLRVWEEMEGVENT
jgi:pimeloyl-ACP methyl ester carboxylesterase